MIHNIAIRNFSVSLIVCSLMLLVLHMLLKLDEAVSEEEIATMTDDELESNFKPCSSTVSKKRRPVPIITADLSAAINRTNVSNHCATLLLAETAKSLGHDISSIAVNPESIRTARLQFRKQRAEATKSSFDPLVPLVVHWDTKMLPDITGVEQADSIGVWFSSTAASEWQTKHLAIESLLWFRSGM